MKVLGVIECLFFSGNGSLVYLSNSVKGLFYQGLTRGWENVYLANPGVMEREFSSLFHGS